MNEFEARNPKQLDICLRLLYAENVQFFVRVTETEKRRIVYKIAVIAEPQTIELLMEKYRILIS